METESHSGNEWGAAYEKTDIQTATADRQNRARNRLLQRVVVIEEFVIDRHELWKYMPYYKVGDPCVWDLTVAVIITVALCWASAERKSPSSMADSELSVEKGKFAP